MRKKFTFPHSGPPVIHRNLLSRFFLLGCMLLLYARAHATYVPVTVTGFNIDAVCNGSGTAPGTTSGLGSTAASPSGFDGGGYWLTDSTFNPGIGTPPGGAMPPSLNVTSAITPGLYWTLQSYSSNNALRINSATAPLTTDSLVFPTGTNAVAAAELYLLYTNIQYTNGDSVFITVNFNDGTTQAPVPQSVPNWFSTSGFTPARAIGCRYNGNGSGSWDNQGTSSGPMLYQMKITLLPANYSKTIRSLTISHKVTNANNALYIFGVTLNTVCTGPVTAGTVASSAGSSVCPSVNFNLSLPAASSGGGMTYQWQSSATGGAPWTTIANATNATYTANQAAATTYRAYIICNGGSSDTTAPLTVTMKAPSQCYCIPVASSNTYYINNFSTTGGTTNISNSSSGPGTTSMGYSMVLNQVVTAMQTTSINFSGNFGSGSYGVAIYADWNQNGILTDPGEKVYTSGSGYVTSFSGSFTIPVSALPGNTRMRVYADYYSPTTAFGPCAFSSSGPYGEAEDYTINVLALPACAAPTAQPAALVLTPTSTTVAGSFTAASPAPNKYIVLRTPGTAAPTVNPATGAVYTVGSALGNAVVISAGTSAITFNDATVTPSTQYTYTVFSYNDICTGTPPLYDTIAPLTANVTTAGNTVYTWNGNANSSKDWQAAANWTPNRTTPATSDILQFTNGLQDSVTNIPVQTVARILVSGNTNVIATVTTAATLTIASDNTPATKELQVDSASGWLSNGAAAGLTINFSGTGSTVKIAGTLEMMCPSASYLNTVNFANATDTITASGVLAAGGNNSLHTGNYFSGSTAANMQMYGTYNHKYATINGGSLPTATWQAGSNFLMSGYTTATGGPTSGNLNQSFYNVTYNCPGQTSTTNWSGTVFTTLNNLSIVSTGTGIWQWGTTTSTTMNIKNLVVSGGTFQGGATQTTAYTWNVDSVAVSGGKLLAATTGTYQWVLGALTQTGGIIDIGSGTATGNQNVYLTRNLNQTGGTFLASAATGSASFPTTINFNGSGIIPQTVSFYNAAPAGGISYRILNPNGISLTGSGTLTGNFNINAYGGVRISTGAVNPINTALTLNYAAANTLLTFDNTGTTVPSSATNVAPLWPAAAAPASVSLNIGNANWITVPSSQTISGTLTMTSGDMDFGNNTLTIGTAAATPGTLTWTAGNVRLGNAGSMVRWYNTSGLPVAAGTGIGYYPVAASGGAGRSVSLYFSAAAITTGGTIAVNHATAAGMTTGLSVADGTYTINKRTNSSWTFTPAAINLSAVTMGMKLTATGLYSATPANTTNMRVMQASSVVGTHAAGTATTALRTGITLANLGASVPYYIGAADTNIAGVYIAINSGNWSTGSTWDVGTPPGIGDNAFINSGVTVMSDPASNTAKSLTIWPGGTLQVNSSTVTIDSTLINNGTVSVAGGTLNVNGNTGAAGITNAAGANFIMSSGAANLGPAGGGNKPFTNNGTLTVNGGNLKVNGSFINNNFLIQSAGDIRVDGNAGGNPASSVAGGTSIVTFASANMNFSGGTFTITDPHVSSAANSYAFNYTAGTFNDTILHTFIFGDSTSTDSSANTAQGMYLKASSGSKFGFGNIIVNGSPTGSNRFITIYSQAPGLVVNGNVTVNNYGDLRINATSGNQLYLNGNLTVNAGGKLTSDIINFSDYSNGVKPSRRSTTVTVNGNGIITNYAGTANFKTVTVNNPNGVTFNMGSTVSFTGTFTFDITGSGTYGVVGPTRVYMANNSILSELSGASAASYSQTNGWVAGRYQKAAGTGGITHTYPIGDSLYYTPLVLNGAAGAVTAAGAFWAQARVPDHPQIAASTIHPGRSINRFFTLTPLNGIAIAPNMIGATMNWAPSDADAGMITANNKVGSYNGTAWTYPAVSNKNATSITDTLPALTATADFVIGNGCAALNISTQPASQVICIGSPAVFSVGMPDTSFVNYQWNKNGAAIPGATSRTFSIPATAATDTGSYTVVLSSICSSLSTVTSAVATLGLNAPPAITTQPAAQAVCENSPASFSVTATGTAIGYQWMKNGVSIAGATNSTYTIPAAATADSGNYSVQIIGAAPCGSLASNAVSLTVKPLPLTITASGTTTFCTGGSVTLSAAAAPATLTYQWQNGTAALSGQTSASYVATNTGNYSAVITNTANGCSGTSNVIPVTNAAPASTITPSGTVSFCQGDTVTLSGPLVGGITYQWTLNGNPVSTAAIYKATAPGSYVLTVYTSPACAGVSAPTVLNMNTLPAVTVTPSGNTTFCQGGSVTLNASPATGLSYSWNKNGSTITPAASAAAYTATASGSYTVSVTSTATGCHNTSAATVVTVNPLPAVTVTSSGPIAFCQGGTDTLKANPATGLNYVWKVNGNPVVPAATNANYAATAGGSYTVAVTDQVTGCQNTSAVTVITVNPLPVVNVTASNGLTLCQGGSTALCLSPALANQAYTWKLNGTPVTGATTSCYTANASGSYTITAVNTLTGCSATSNPSVVTVNPLPVSAITLLSASATACAGDTVWLLGNNDPGLSYAWYKNGGTLVANTISYGATASGIYTLVTTNTATGCTKTSAPQTVTVNPRPNSSIAYTTPITFCDGGAVVLNAVSGTGITYQWQNNGAQIAGATDNYYVAAQNGSYAVKVTNSYGCSDVSNPPVLVVSNPLPQPQIVRNGNILSTGAYATYQWFRNSQPIAGATTQSYTVTQNGGYAVQVSDVLSCTNYSGIYFFNNVSVGNISARDIRLYPNPASHMLYIDAQEPVNITIRDVQGRVLLTKDKAKDIDISQLAAGIYTVLLTDTDGHPLKVEKLVKAE